MKIPAIKTAAERKDPTAARQLVEDLGSDDPAVRLYAINGLERLSGQRLGYEYYADESQRNAAIGRWREWLAKQEQQQPKPASHPR